MTHIEDQLSPSFNHSPLPQLGRVIVGCVADNNPKYLAQALRLLSSMRWFGGRMAEVDFFVCIVDEADQTYVHKFEQLGASVRIVPRFSSHHPPSNKLRFLALPELNAYDTIILLDCDTVIVQDPLPYLTGQVFQAKIADLPTVPHDILRRVFEHFELEMPPQNYQCNPVRASTIWYCNAGVLIFPYPILQKLGPVWETYNNALLERLDLLETHTFLCEQVSLALAFAAQPAPFNELPLAMNFPLNLTDWADVTVMEQVDPIILHYHNCIDVLGYLRASPYPKVQKRIEQFNQQLHEHRRHSFDNQTFWDYRYWHNPDLGSGIGSRGPAITYKQETLQRIEKLYQPDSILDIGCGDQMVSQVLSDAIYTGVDLSPVIIERNRLNYPQRKFIAGDVLNLDLPPADFVICLDMLIHLNSESRYQATVACLVELTQHVGLISGYETPPTDPPDITFYYEPLSQTLLQAGARELQAVGHYKNVTLWAFKTDTSTRSPLLADPPAALLHKPLFVAGCMRSGTTLLADLVGEFQGVVHCPFELKHIWSTVGQVAMASPRTRDTECLQLGAADVQPGQAEKLAQAFRAEMMKYKKLEDQPNLIFLNKNPHLCNKLPFVNGLFPDARFIWIYRHLPQVVASLKVLFEQVNQRQQTWHYWPEPQPQVMARCWQAFHFEPPPAEVDPARCFPGGDIKYLAEYWLENNQAIAEFFQYLPVDQKLAVREETLIEQPEDQLARCLAFLGLPLDNMVNDLDSLDPTRNQLWPSQLTMTESLSLFEFVAAHAQQIEALFPDENRAALYRDQLAALLLVSNPNTIEASPATLIPEQELTALRTEMAALTAERNDYQLQLTTIFNTRAWKLMTKAWLVSGSVRKLKTLIRNKLV